MRGSDNRDHVLRNKQGDQFDGPIGFETFTVRAKVLVWEVGPRGRARSGRRGWAV